MLYGCVAILLTTSAVYGESIMTLAPQILAGSVGMLCLAAAFVVVPVIRLVRSGAIKTSDCCKHSSRWTSFVYGLAIPPVETGGAIRGHWISCAASPRLPRVKTLRYDSCQP